MKKPIIVIAGPTAAGKTRLSISLAKAAGGEIISADSMQIYKGMDIGSAKVTTEEMQGIPHYLIDELEPDEPFHVMRFQSMAKEALKTIYERKHIPIIAGGTGFYIQSLLYDIDFTETENDEVYRKYLEELQQEKGSAYLHELLTEKDPKAASEIHANNYKRIIRALEYYHLTGEPISTHNEMQKKKQSPYQYLYFVITDERQHLYEQIELRVDKMLADGLVDEVALLRAKGYTKDMVSMQGLGYKEILAYLEGECTLEEAIYILKRDTRHFAKRQLTWFKREKETIWLDRSVFGYDDEAVLHQILEYMKEKDMWEKN